MNNPKAAIRWAVVATSAIYAGVLYATGTRVAHDARQLLAYLPTLAGLGLVVFDSWVWRSPGIRKLHSRPWIGGLWRTTLAPDAQSHIPEGGNRGPILAYLVIEQSFWGVAVTQWTAESESHSRATAYVRFPDSAARVLNFTYDNVPRREHLPRSPRHGGACAIMLPKGIPTSLEGAYFTDRFTAGEMALVLVDRSTSYSGFVSAHEHAEKTRKSTADAPQ